METPPHAHTNTGYQWKQLISVGGDISGGARSQDLQPRAAQQLEQLRNLIRHRKNFKKLFLMSASHKMFNL